MALVVPDGQKIPENNKECRICFELDSIDNLIWPCSCNGSIKYVHESCLIKWIETTTNEEYKKKCPMCKNYYFIKKDYKKETNIFTVTTGILNMLLELMLVEILVIVLACTISAIDNTTNSYSTRILSFNSYKTDKLDHTIKSTFNITYNNINNFGRDIAILFYYNYAHYNFYLFSFIVFSIYIYKNLQNKKIYYNTMKLKLLLYVFYYNFFFIFFNLLMWTDSYNSALFFNIFMTIISYLNFFIFKTFIILHNDTLITINDKYYKIRILSVEPNPLLMV